MTDTDVTDSVSGLRAALLEVSEGLAAVAATLHMAGSPGETSRLLVQLGPALDQICVELGRLFPD